MGDFMFDNRTDYLINLIGEECQEIGIRVSKILRFGLNEVQPGQGQDNLERLRFELDDLAGVLELLNDTCPGAYEPDRERINAKKRKVEQFMAYSVQCGRMAPEALTQGVSNDDSNVAKRN